MKMSPIQGPQESLSPSGPGQERLPRGTRLAQGLLCRRTTPYRQVGSRHADPKNCPCKVKDFSVSTVATYDFICEALGTAQTHKEHKGKSTERQRQLQPSPLPVQVL